MSDEPVSCADIILLYQIQADIAEKKGWIRREDVARAEHAFVERRSRGHRIDLAETIADIGRLTQTNLDELRKLAMLESLKIEALRASRKESSEAKVAVSAPPSSPASSPSRRSVALVGLAAGVLAVGALFALLLQISKPRDIGPSETLSPGEEPSRDEPVLPVDPSPVELPTRGEPPVADRREPSLRPADDGAILPGSARPDVPGRSEPEAAGDPETRAFLEGVFSGDDPDTPLDLDTPREPIGPEEFLRRLQGDG